MINHAETIKNLLKKADRRIVAAAYGCTCVLSLIILASLGLSAEFIIMMGAILTLCGLLLYDVFSRRQWESVVTEKIRIMSEYHDRLVREVSRNRSDLAMLREALSDTATHVEEQGRRANPSASIEARMIETIVAQLKSLGARQEQRIIEIRHNPYIMELEMSPPPPVREPRFNSDMDSEIMPDFEKISDSVVLDLINHAVRNDSVEVFMQPIVSLPQRKTRFYEVYGRIRAGAGTYVPAARYLDLAHREQLVPAIDNLLLLRCLQLLHTRRKGESDVAYILNIAGATLSDRGFMGDLVNFLSQNRPMAARLIFEIPQKDMTALGEIIVPVMRGLTQLGCRFSMDGVRQRRLDVNQLKSRQIRFIKMDAAWLIKEGKAQDGFSRIIRLKKQLDAAGIDMIVEKIENENILRELLDFNIDFGQGYLFGKPDTPATWGEARNVA